MIDSKVMNDAVDIVEAYYIDEDIDVDLDEIEDTVLDWYKHIRFEDPTLLAAAAISGNYEPTTIEELVWLRNFYFFDSDLDFTYPDCCYEETKTD